LYAKFYVSESVYIARLYTIHACTYLLRPREITTDERRDRKRKMDGREREGRITSLQDVYVCMKGEKHREREKERERERERERENEYFVVDRGPHDRVCPRSGTQRSMLSVQG